LASDTTGTVSAYVDSTSCVAARLHEKQATRANLAAVRRGLGQPEVLSGTESSIQLAGLWCNTGQLGCGDTRARAAPQLLRDLGSISLTSLACGSGHSVAIDAAGGAHAWGDGASGQLGTGDRADRVTPELVRLDGQRVTRAACGARHSLLATARGRVLSCGHNGRGQLGLGELPRGALSCDRPRLLDELLGTRVLELWAGFEHSYFLSGAGLLLSCGAGDLGQLGQGSLADAHAPAAVVGLAVLVHTAASGNYHGLALTEDGVMSWGEGLYGRLGHGTSGREAVPRRVVGLEGLVVTSVACGGACSAAVTADGELYTWGSSTWRQCGHEEGTEQLEPRRLEALSAVQVRQAEPNPNHSPNPDPNPNPNRNHNPNQVRQADGGEDHMAVLTSIGTVLTWGR
jgi:alpha-tubulin suppressor-like RCC1 family protein